MRLNTAGDSLDDGSSTTGVDFLSFGTERGSSFILRRSRLEIRNALPPTQMLTWIAPTGRDTHELHWPLWAAVEYGLTPSGSVTSKILYAFVRLFPQLGNTLTLV